VRTIEEIQGVFTREKASTQNYPTIEVHDCGIQVYTHVYASMSITYCWFDIRFGSF